MQSFSGVLLAGCLAGVPVAAAQVAGDIDGLFPQQLSAKTLLTYCASSSMTDRGRQRQRYCAGFVSGVEESLRLLKMQSAPDRNLPLCVPADVTARGLQQAYVRYAGRAGSDLKRPAALVAVEALRAAYPCRGD